LKTIGIGSKRTVGDTFYKKLPLTLKKKL